MMQEQVKGPLVIEGKTKLVYELTQTGSGNEEKLVLVQNKDRITAFDGARSHELEGKAAISNSTNAKVFEFLNNVGFKTSFLRTVDETNYVAKRCNMVPLEWVTRRVATGSFLRRNPGVKEGFRFNPPKLETFLKDDANNDPQWSEEQILEAALEVGGLRIGKMEYEIMAKTTVAVFEVLERAWNSLDCALVDMKIEFGVDHVTKEIIVSDTIDSDSWRLWPSGDKRLMKDKQVYRNLKTVTTDSLDEVKRNFQWVSDRLDYFIPESKALVVIIMGSPSDKPHCEKINKYCNELGLNVIIRVCSAHKTTSDTLDLIAEYEGMNIPVVFIAVAGRSNGLGPVLSGNTSIPVLNCPPLNAEEISRDIWSSLNIPSGLGCCTVLYPEAAAQHASSIFGQIDHVIWSKIRAKKLRLWRNLKEADKKMMMHSQH